MLPGYLTLPLNSSGKKVPMVVYPHGGPYARDSWGFDPMVQFMASRGYAVLQVNFRGSTGYGDEWYDAGLRNWGTVMVDDITAATNWAISQGIADPAHVCIVGWSYGGYAALMSAVREPDLYKCAVSIAGVSDLRALARRSASFLRWPLPRQVFDRLGHRRAQGRLAAAQPGEDQGAGAAGARRRRHPGDGRSQPPHGARAASARTRSTSS